jgi:hypothetical protein
MLSFTQRPATEDLRGKLFGADETHLAHVYNILRRGEMVTVPLLAVSTLTAFCPNPPTGVHCEVVLGLLGISFKEENDKLQSMDGSACWPSTQCGLVEGTEYSGAVFVLHWHLVSIRVWFQSESLSCVFAELFLKIEHLFHSADTLH